MGGFLGIGGSSAKTDRATQLAAQQGDWNIFGYGMPAGQAGQATGQADLSTAMSSLGGPQQYFQNLLTAGRTQTAQNAAPAVDQALANATATRNAEGTFGTSRTGGTVAANREASSNTQSQIDQIINTNLQTGKAQGAAGLQEISAAQAGIGGQELANSLQLLGLSQDSINAIMNNATGSRATSFDINSATQAQWGQVIGSLVSAGES
jgi:hypothetical protein